MNDKFSVDDRGNVAQFYDEHFEIIATLDREAEVDGKPDQKTWDGGPAITRWAKLNGHAKDIESARKI